MIRYYCETKDEKIVFVVFQDESGVFIAKKNKKDIIIVQRDEVHKTWIQFGSSEPQQVMTIERDYLEFIKNFERNYYMDTKPTEIAEFDGSKQEFLNYIL